MLKEIIKIEAKKKQSEQEYRRGYLDGKEDGFSEGYEKGYASAKGIYKPKDFYDLDNENLN